MKCNMNNPYNINQKIEKAKDLIINSIGKTMDLYGTNRGVGSLYSTVAFEGSMTLDEMREHLQMSESSISAGIKKLREYDIVRQQFTCSSHKQHFIAGENFFNLFRNFFTQKWEREVDVSLEAIKKAENILHNMIQTNNLSKERKKKNR